MVRNCGNSVIVHFMKLIRLFKTRQAKHRDLGPRHRRNEILVAMALFFAGFGAQSATCPGNMATKAGQDFAQVGIFDLFDIGLA